MGILWEWKRTFEKNDYYVRRSVFCGHTNLANIKCVTISLPVWTCFQINHYRNLRVNVPTVKRAFCAKGKCKHGAQQGVIENTGSYVVVSGSSQRIFAATFGRDWSRNFGPSAWFRQYKMPTHLKPCHVSWQCHDIYDIYDKSCPSWQLCLLIFFGEQKGANISKTCCEQFYL